MLGEHPFLRGLSPDAVEAVAGCASNVRFAEGDALFAAGDAADRVYLIRHGTVELDTGRTLGPGDVAGWPWLLHPYRWPFGARAATLVRATALEGACLRVRCEYDERLGYHLMARFAQSLFER